MLKSEIVAAAHVEALEQPPDILDAAAAREVQIPMAVGDIRQVGAERVVPVPHVALLPVVTIRQRLEPVAKREPYARPVHRRSDIDVAIDHRAVRAEHGDRLSVQPVSPIRSLPSAWWSSSGHRSSTCRSRAWC